MRTATTLDSRNRPIISGIALVFAIALFLFAPRSVSGMGLPGPFDPPMEPLTLEEIAGVLKIVEQGGSKFIGIAVLNAILQDKIREDLYGNNPLFCTDPNCETRKQAVEALNTQKPGAAGEPSEWDIPKLTEVLREAIMEDLDDALSDLPKKEQQGNNAEPEQPSRPDIPDAKADFDCSKKPRGITGILKHATMC